MKEKDTFARVVAAGAVALSVIEGVGILLDRKAHVDEKLTQDIADCVNEDFFNLTTGTGPMLSLKQCQEEWANWRHVFDTHPHDVMHGEPAPTPSGPSE